MRTIHDGMTLANKPIPAPPAAETATASATPTVDLVNVESGASARPVRSNLLVVPAFNEVLLLSLAQKMSAPVGQTRSRKTAEQSPTEGEAMGQAPEVQKARWGEV